MDVVGSCPDPPSEPRHSAPGPSPGRCPQLKGAAVFQAVPLRDSSLQPVTDQSVRGTETRPLPYLGHPSFGAFRGIS